MARGAKKNISVIAAIGCLPRDNIERAAADIYRTGVHTSQSSLRIRLVAVGRERCENLAATYPRVTQLTWPKMLAFILKRFYRYRRQKTQVDQWDSEGLKIKKSAEDFGNSRKFVETASPLLRPRYRGSIG